MWVPRNYVAAPTANGSFLRSLGDEWDEFRGTETGQVPVWNASTGWQLGSSGAGSIVPLAATAETVGLWLLNGSLANSVDASNPLTLELGSAYYADIVPGKKAFYFDSGTRLIVSAFVPALALTGDYTSLSVWQLDGDPNGTQGLLGHGAIGTTAAVNILFSTTIIGGPPPRRLNYLSESGAGVAANYTTSGVDSLPPIHNLMLIGTSRIANVVTNYHNGVQFGLPSSVITTPSGGGSGRFRVGSSDGNQSMSRIVCWGVRLDNVGRTAAEHRAIYNATLGQGFGLI